MLKWRDAVPPEQFAFILAGKWYLLARMVYQVAILASFAWLARTRTLVPDAWTMIGALLMICGVALRAWAMGSLGERFRGFEVTREERGLETRGPYAIVRHPSYLALAMIDLGTPLVLSLPRLTALGDHPAGRHAASHLARG